MTTSRNASYADVEEKVTTRGMGFRSIWLSRQRWFPKRIPRVGELNNVVGAGRCMWGIAAARAGAGRCGLMSVCGASFGARVERHAVVDLGDAQEDAGRVVGLGDAQDDAGRVVGFGSAAKRRGKGRSGAIEAKQPPAVLVSTVGFIPANRSRPTEWAIVMYAHV